MKRRSSLNGALLGLRTQCDRNPSSLLEEDYACYNSYIEVGTRNPRWSAGIGDEYAVLYEINFTNTGYLACPDSEVAFDLDCANHHRRSFERGGFRPRTAYRNSRPTAHVKTINDEDCSRPGFDLTTEFATF